MKSSAVVLLLAVSAIALASDVTPAFASKMDGKCCQFSDGGRSWRYRLEACQAAKAQCMRTGAYVGPYSGWHLAGMQKK